MVNTKVTLSGWTLDNPVIPASGTFGYGDEFKDFYDINILGTFSFKGTTKEPRFGNPTPRIAECREGLINSVGLQNPGIEAVINEELPKMKKFFDKKVIANISGFSLDEYVYCCEKIDKEDQVGIIEVNISCPNVHGGGMAFGTDPKMAAEITRAVKAVTTKPVYIKLSPNVTDIVSIAKACEDAGADGLSLINTLLGMRINLKTGKPIIANTMGGFSGPAIFPVALRMVYQVAHAVKVPVIGMGGVSTAEDVIEMMYAGATAVQVGAANLKNPYACKEIIEDLPRVMEKYGSLDRVSMTSDGNGSAPIWDELGNMIGMGKGSCKVLLADLKKAADRGIIPFEEVLKTMTTTPAKIYGLKNSAGRIVEDGTANFAILDSELNLSETILNGTAVWYNGKVINHD